ncbi:MAG: nicotinate-nucleotide adenylyltransferase [Cellulosilyticaceae bacterium]
MVVQMKKIRKLAIMGGTFDPIHIGHLVTAEAVRNEFDIDEVLFVPTGNPPHKSNIDVTPTEHRYLMTVLATTANTQFNVSRIEIDREGVTYTIDTLKELKSIYGEEVKLYFITGADAIQQILTWKASEQLLQICTFVAVTRPGYHKQELLDKVQCLRQQFESSIKFLEVPALAISSSDIRKRVEQGRPIKYLVTEEVEKYIDKHKLYVHQISFNKELVMEMNNYVLQRVSTARYAHIKGVVQMALELAKIHDVDTDKIFVAALFHDVAKELSEEKMLEACIMYKIELDEFEKTHINLGHGKVGAGILKADWGIQDEIILDSIRYHTMGREHMTKIDKIIYLADMIEYGRKPYAGLEELRRIALYDLDKAMYKALKSSKDYVESQGGEVHPKTQGLIEEYENIIK